MRRVRIAVILAGALLAGGCRGDEPREAPSPRVVALAPHIADLAWAMGVGDHVVGVSRYCQLPAGVDRPVVGDIKTDVEAILAQRPDVIFHNQREQDLQALSTLAPEVRLVRLPNATIDELLDSIDRMGAAMGEAPAAEALRARIEAELAAVARAVVDRPQPRTLLVLGRQSPAVVGPEFTTGQLLEIAGGRNVAAECGLRSWSTPGLERLMACEAEVLICLETSAAAGERARAHWAELAGRNLAPADRVVVLADPMLTIGGAGVGRTARRFAEALHGVAATQEAGP
jgi:iron complex transport system substrate-binding protein